MQTSPNFPSSDAASSVHRGVDAAGAALHSGINRVADPVRQTVDSLSSAAHSTVDKFASSASQTADRFSDQTRRVSEAPARVLARSKSWVQARPLEAVGAALALGFIAGWLTRR